MTPIINTFTWTLILTVYFLFVQITVIKRGRNNDVKCQVVPRFSTHEYVGPVNTTTTIGLARRTTIAPIRNPVYNSSLVWPNGTVPYIISPLYNDVDRNKILDAMREIEGDVNRVNDICVQFVPRTNHANYIHIFNGNVCKAHVGMLNRGQHNVSLALGCLMQSGVIMHELIHVLGFEHEQKRFDRDTYININWTNIIDNRKWSFYKNSGPSLSTVNTSYDFGSIMHYAAYTMAINKFLPVITPKSPHVLQYQMGQRMTLSDNDVLRIQRVYGCIEDTTHIRRTFQIGGLTSCNFTRDLCYLTQNASSNVQWTIKQPSSVGVPTAGTTYGADPYLIASEGHLNGTARIVTTVFRVYPIMCVSFNLFQLGPLSHIKVIVQGTSISTTVVATFQGRYTNRWQNVRQNVITPGAVPFQVTLQAEISRGNVAIDDLYIYKGRCI